MDVALADSLLSSPSTKENWMCYSTCLIYIKARASHSRVSYLVSTTWLYRSTSRTRNFSMPLSLRVYAREPSVRPYSSRNRWLWVKLKTHTKKHIHAKKVTTPKKVSDTEDDRDHGRKGARRPKIKQIARWTRGLGPIPNTLLHPVQHPPFENLWQSEGTKHDLMSYCTLTPCKWGETTRHTANSKELWDTTQMTATPETTNRRTHLEGRTKKVCPIAHSNQEGTKSIFNKWQCTTWKANQR